MSFPPTDSFSTVNTILFSRLISAAILLLNAFITWFLCICFCTVPHGLSPRPTLHASTRIGAIARYRTTGCLAGKSGRSVPAHRRSEEHTSELQSLMRISYAVFCLTKKNCLSTLHVSIAHFSTIYSLCL